MFVNAAATFGFTSLGPAPMGIAAGDYDGDGDLDVVEINGPFIDGGGILISLFCPPPPPLTCEGDIDGDGVVGINDFLDLLAAWGPCK